MKMILIGKGKTGIAGHSVDHLYPILQQLLT